METFQRLTGRAAPALRIFLGLFLVYAGTGKLLDVSAFAAQIQRLGVSNSLLATIGANYLPFVELVCGISLLTRSLLIGGTVLSVLLLAMFEVFLISSWAAGTQGECGCFGALFGAFSIQGAICRNIALMAIACVTLFHECAAIMPNGRRMAS